MLTASIGFGYTESMPQRAVTGPRNLSLTLPKPAASKDYLFLPSLLLSLQRTLLGRNQSLRQLQRIHQPKTLRPGMVHVRLSGRRAASEQGFDPLGGNGASTPHSAQ